MKLCLIYNGAPHYRDGIFKLVEKEYDCDWFFGPGYGKIRQLPMSMFKNATVLQRKNLPLAFFYQKGEIKTLLSKKYDIFFILGETPNASTWLGMILHNLFNRKTKVYYWSHGYQRDRGFLRNIFERLFMKLPYASFIYGDYAIDFMIKDGFDKSKLFPIHNSLNYDEQVALRGNITNIYKDHFKNDSPVLIFIGRLTPIKKLYLIIEAMDILRQKGIHVNCVFIGDGDVKEDLQSLVELKKLKDSVWFYGACYSEMEKSVLIANAYLCVAPGNIGLTAMDSLVYGTPAITMNNYGMQMPEFEAIREGVTGAFFQEDSAEDLAKQIYKWLNIGFNREQVRLNCYKEIDEKWNPEYQIEIIKQNLKP